MITYNSLANTLQTSFSGGMTAATFGHISHEWRWIICLYLVRHPLLSLAEYHSNLLRFSSNLRLCRAHIQQRLHYIVPSTEPPFSANN